MVVGSLTTRKVAELDREGRVVTVFTQRVDWNTVDFQKSMEQYIRLPGR